MSVSNEREVWKMKEVSNKVMESIVVYMDYEIREQVHAELAPCTNEEFIKRYCELDPSIEYVLHCEFGIELNKEKKVRGMKESIEVKDIVEKINSHISVLKRGDPKAFDMECSRKVISCLFNTLILMLNITFDEAIDLVGIEDLFLFM